MKDSLFRIVTSAVTSFNAKVRPSLEDRRSAAARRLADLDQAHHAAALAKLNHPFVQRADFDRQLLALLGDSSQEIERLALSLQGLRERVVSLRSEFAASQGATEATWDGVKARLAKGQGELLAAFRGLRQATKIAP